MIVLRAVATKPGATPRARAHRAVTLSAVPTLAWLALFVIIPIGIAVVVSLRQSDAYGLRADWTLQQWQRIFGNRLYIGLLFKTLRIAVVTTALSLLIAYPVALYLTQLRETPKRAVLLLLFVPFWVGFVVRTFAWLPILGRNGLINQSLLALGIIDQPLEWLLYNEGAVYLGLINGYLLFMILPIFLSLERIDRSLREAAQDLHASELAIWRHVLLPLSMPGVLSGCVMVFLLAFGAYVTPALLGGPSGIMYSNVIAQQFIGDNNWAFGCALSILMTVGVLAVVFAAGQRMSLQRVFAATKGT
jgi:spermidine/putrescine transport system permease protein